MPDNLYRRGKSGIWQARAFVRGREVRESLHTDDLAEAKRRLKRFLTKVSELRFGEERHTWHAAAGKWMADAARSHAPSTVKRYVVSFKAVEPVLGPLYLDQIDRSVLARIAGRRDVTNATRRRDLTAVGAVLHAAESWGWIEAAPAFNRKTLKERRFIIELPPDAEVTAFIARCHETRFRGLPGTLGYLAELLVHTGMRLEEATGLQRREVDLRGGRITLHRTKTGRARVVPLGDPLLAQATGTLERLPVRLACPYVFWWGDGQPYATASHLLSRIRKAMGLKWRTHDLRHLMAVRYMRAGGSIYALAKILGHTSVQTTERFYLDHLTPEEAERARMAG